MPHKMSARRAPVWLALVGAAVLLAPRGTPAQSPGAGPIVVMETSKGTIEFETYPEDAPKTVEHVLGLVRRGFYNGLRFHRVEPNFLVQIGDRQSRDMTRQEWWGRGGASLGSGRTVGIAEFSKKRLHTRGAVAMAHAGDARQADSQFYITRRVAPQLDGKYTVIGQVISGMAVVDRIEFADMLKKMYIKE